MDPLVSRAEKYGTSKIITDESATNQTYLKSDGNVYNKMNHYSRPTYVQLNKVSTGINTADEITNFEHYYILELDWSDPFDKSWNRKESVLNNKETDIICIVVDHTT